MRMNPPTKVVFWISVVLGLLGLLGQLGVVAALSGFAFWLVFVGFAVLVASLFVKGM